MILGIEEIGSNGHTGASNHHVRGMQPQTKRYEHNIISYVGSACMGVGVRGLAISKPGS